MVSFYEIIRKDMKESVLIKMQYDLKLVQQALVVALTRLDRLEEKKVEEK